MNDILRCDECNRQIDSDSEIGFAINKRHGDLSVKCKDCIPEKDYDNRHPLLKRDSKAEDNETKEPKLVPEVEDPSQEEIRKTVDKVLGKVFG